MQASSPLRAPRAGPIPLVQQPHLFRAVPAVGMKRGSSDQVNGERFRRAQGKSHRDADLGFGFRVVLAQSSLKILQLGVSWLQDISIVGNLLLQAIDDFVCLAKLVAFRPLALFVLGNFLLQRLVQLQYVGPLRCYICSKFLDQPAVLVHLVWLLEFLDNSVCVWEIAAQKKHDEINDAEMRDSRGLFLRNLEKGECPHKKIKINCKLGTEIRMKQGFSQFGFHNHRSLFPKRERTKLPFSKWRIIR